MWDLIVRELKKFIDPENGAQYVFERAPMT